MINFIQDSTTSTNPTLELAEHYRQLTLNFIKTMPKTKPNPDESELPAFKIYRNLPRYNLHYPLPLQLEVAGDNWQALTVLLHYTLGLNQLRISPEHAALYGRKEPGEGFINRIIRRNVPSGGALYPSELYLWLPGGWPMPAGLYYYDAAHHQLVLLRAGIFSLEIAQALGLPESDVLQQVVLFSSLRLTKNLPKYGDFSYRLQALDNGVVQGRLLTLGQALGWQPKVHWRFLDKPLNNLLELDTLEESIYQVNLLQRSPVQSELTVAQVLPTVEKPEYTNPADLPTLSPLLQNLHLASLYTEPAQLAPETKPATEQVQMVAAGELKKLQRAISERCSEGSAFNGQPIERSALLELARASRQMLDSFSRLDTTVELDFRILVQNVTGLAPGIYSYSKEAATLRFEAPVVNLLSKLTAANFFVNTFNFRRINATFYPIGSYQPSFGRYGNRGFRMLNLAAGCLIEAAQTAGQAAGLSTANYLGYDIGKVNTLLQLPAGVDSLMQLFIGQLASESLAHYQTFLY